MIDNDFYKIYKRFWNISKIKYRKSIYHLIILLAIVMLSAGLSSLIPYIMKDIVNYSSTLNNNGFSKISILYLLVISYCIAWITQEIFNWIKNILSAFVMVKFETSLIYSSLDNFFNLTYSEQKKIDVGVFNSDLTRGASAFGQINYTLLLIIFPIIAQLIFMCVFLTFNINLTFSVLFFLTSIIIFFITYKLNKKSKNYFSAMYESRNKLNKFLIEKTSMPYEIKVHNSKKFELLKMNDLVEDYSSESFKSNKNIGFLMMFQIFLIGLFLIFFMLVSVYLFQKGNLTSGSFVLISSYIIQLTMPFIMVSQSLMQLNGHFISIQKLNHYFDLDKDYLTSEPEPLNSKTLFSFIDASFNLGDKIIYDFNFRILSNKTYAIIGKTGSGKTSFVNFLLGINKINSGKILYKNLDISKHYSEILFNEISFVSQNPIIISGSLKDNLIYNSNLNIKDNHITYLLDVFGLNSILEDNKIKIYDSIDDIYKNFSGGEMQRISIIRSLLKKPKVLILDEPTSSLDQATGLRIINYLKTQIPSIIIITHSQYCIDLCDEVINIEGLKDLFS